MHKHLPTGILIALVTGAALIGLGGQAAARAVQSHAPLVGSSAKGQARFRFDGQEPSTTTVSVENGPQNAIVSVSLEGTVIGSIPLDGSGNGATMIGGIPAPVTGEHVTVTAPTGGVVVSGTFK